VTRLPAHLQHLTEGLPANRKAEIEEAILSSPLLQQRMTEEVQAGRLQHARLQPSGEHSGGYYSNTDRSIYIDSDIFKIKDKTKRLDRITYVLGHETAHSALSEGSALSSKALSDAVHDALWTESDLGHLDLTAPAERYLQYARQDESMATIAAWNVLADRVDHERAGPLTGDAFLKRVAQIGDCAEINGNKAELAPGITLDAQQRIMIGKPLAKSTNVEAVGVCYYDKSAQEAKLGRNGDSDYANHYGAAVIQNIAAQVRGFETETGQRANDIRLNLDQLGLKRTLLESNGLDLGGRPFVLLDTSHGKVRGISLQHTDTGPAGAEADARITQQPAPLMSEPGHHAHTMWTQALNALRSSPNIPAGTFTHHEEERLAAGIVAQAVTQEGAFPKLRIDHVVYNDDRSMGIGVQGPLESPANYLAGVKVQQTLSTSIEQSSDVSRAASQSIQQKQELAIVQTETIGVDAPTASGPVMRMGARTITPASGPSAEAAGGGDGGG
jgi:hypothetical protein